ncbi:MAG: hypothetical protein LAP38_26925 [Acidobacteriia bacterium]|nr:hypothetical protein [Terriglobia bacterium]
MHHQRIAAFLLGAWILGSLFMIFVATQNFSMADTLGNPDTHAALRDMAGRLNQLFFVNWERAELVIGVALVGFLLFGMASRLLASLAGAVAILVAFQHFLVTPEMLSLAAHLDTSENQFMKLHAIYGVMEVVKLVMAFGLAVLLLPSWRRGAVRAVEVQPVDYAHHGHVDR